MRYHFPSQGECGLSKDHFGEILSDMLASGFLPCLYRKLEHSVVATARNCDSTFIDSECLLHFL